MLKTLSAAVLVALSGATLAQTQSGPTTPSAPPSQPQSVTPSPAPAVTPPSDAPVVGAAPSVGSIESRPLGGLSQCDNLIGLQKEQCLQAESAARGNTAPATTATPR